MAFDIARRQFILALGGAAWPLAAHAQQTPMRVVGFLTSLTSAAAVPMAAAFLQGLNESGFTEGRNVAIEYRYADGHYDRLPALAADLVSRKVDVIFASGGSAPALAAKAATTTIPIVFETGGDPVKAGLVASLSRPGGNLTGVTWTASALSAKRLDLLHQLVPTASVIGLVVNPNYPEASIQVGDLKDAAGALGLQISVANADTESGVDAAIASLARQGVGGLLVANDPFFSNSARPDHCARGPLCAAGELFAARRRRDGRPDQLRDELTGAVPPGRPLCRAYPQGRCAGRSSGHAAHKLQSRHQLENCKNPRPHDPARHSRDLRRGD